MCRGARFYPAHARHRRLWAGRPEGPAGPFPTPMGTGYYIGARPTPKGVKIQNMFCLGVRKYEDIKNHRFCLTKIGSKAL